VIEITKIKAIKIPTYGARRVKYEGNTVLTKKRAQEIKNQLRLARDHLMYISIDLQCSEEVPEQKTVPGGVVFKGHLQTYYLAHAAFEIVEWADEILKKHINRKVRQGESRG
jgi:hypothetical protein